MTQEAFAAKPSLQVFLEETLAILSLDLVNTSEPETVRLLFSLWQQGKAPLAAAQYFRFAREARDTANFQAELADARNGLANHAYVTEQQVRAISESITESMGRGGPVTGLLEVSYAAHDLKRLGGLLRVYQEFATLLDIVYDSTASAKMALAATKEEALVRLANLPEAEPGSEGAGALEGLKNIIKILTNRL